MENRNDRAFMKRALRLARRGYGLTSPNPAVGAVLVRNGKIIGEGWHHAAGLPHAEIEALEAARRKGFETRGATLYLTLEPCSTFGRTPPCTTALRDAGLRRVVVAATDPNPRHAGRGYRILRRAGIAVSTGILADESNRLNESFNHWVVRRKPFVTVKAAMSMDGKIATSTGESKWITGPRSRARTMDLRLGADAILAGINTILLDDPSLTWRSRQGPARPGRVLRRLILDARARTPLSARVVSDALAQSTTLVTTRAAARAKVNALRARVQVLIAPVRNGRIDLRWLLRRLGQEGVTSLLVEGGGEVNASFFENGLADRVAFFYSPMIIGGRAARKAVGGKGVSTLKEALRLREVEWTRLGPDLFLTARVG